MSVEPAVCEECSVRIHHHQGRCGKPAEVIIPTSGGGVAKAAPCSCEAPETLGVANADTQLEVAYR